MVPVPADLQRRGKQSHKSFKLIQGNLVMKYVVAKQKGAFVDLSVIAEQYPSFANGWRFAGYQKKTGDITKFANFFALV
jgi:hypothetical protein